MGLFDKLAKAAADLQAKQTQVAQKLVGGTGINDGSPQWRC